MASATAVPVTCGTPPTRPPRRPAPAAWPVRVRKTSSRVGRRRVMSAMPMPAASSRRTASATIEPPAATGTDTRPAWGSTWASPMARADRAVTAARAWPTGVTVTSTTSPPTRALRSSGVPWAITRPLSMTAMASARRSASSRYWVVSRRVVPGVDQLGHDLPQPDAAAGVEPRRGLVEEEHLGPADQAGAQVEAPAHAARVGAHPPVGGRHQVEALEHLARPAGGLGLAQVVEPADQHQVLPAGERLVDGRELPGQADHRPHLRRLLDHVEAGDHGPAAVRAAGGW